MTDTGLSAAAPRRWPRWKGIVFVVSLALNLLVLGLVATAAIRHRFAPPPPGPAAQANVLGFARTLNPPRRIELWQATKAEREELRPFRLELRQARDAVRQALLTEPFDAARFKEAHARQLQAEDAARKAAHALFETIALKLTPDERRAFVRWQSMWERPWRRGRFGRGPGDDNMPPDAEGPSSKQ